MLKVHNSEYWKNIVQQLKDNKDTHLMTPQEWKALQDAKEFSKKIDKEVSMKTQQDILKRWKNKK